MAALRSFLPLLLLLPLAGCFSDQKAKLSACEVTAPRTGLGQPLKSIQGCMEQAGYRFIGWDDGVVCNMTAVTRGQFQSDGTDALCFEPKNWLALKLYRIEVPARAPRAG
jgi:hypothetical protein